MTKAIYHVGCGVAKWIHTAHFVSVGVDATTIEKLGVLGNRNFVKHRLCNFTIVKATWVDVCIADVAFAVACCGNLFANAVVALGNCYVHSVFQSDDGIG